MVICLHDTFYDVKATLLSEADIKEIRESRGRIRNASKKMADKFHIGPKRVYEIWDNKECLQQGVISSQPALDKKNSQTDKTEQTLEVVSETDEKLVTGASSMVEKNNKNNVASSADNLSDISREDRLDSLLENLVNRGEKLKGLTANTTPLI
ncbi:hypothetical protein C1646_774445 [Rhizophagus diaphanus]|nr:hypothetical protein C1646_774445 [Rhizophagus diaphanus] [Rhizophagus sp. MUCL 43196]